MSSHSVSILLEAMKDGDEDARNKIAQRYFEKVAAIAEKKVRLCRTTGGEDVAAEVFAQFFKTLSTKGYSELNDRNNLWAILSTMMEGHSKNAIRHSLAEKRDARRTQSQDNDSSPGFDNYGSIDPSESDVDELLETLEKALGQLAPGIREIATLRMQGHSIAEIAEKMDSSKATVERRLKIARERWRVDQND